MVITKYTHPWTQDQALTDRLLKLVDDEDWDLFGIADVGPLNEKAAPGNRGDRISSCAELITLGYLMGFREKLEFQGYKTALIPPSPLL